MNAWANFNDAEEQTGGDVIPKGTLAKVHMKVRPGGYDDASQGWTGGIATRSDKSGAVYLDCEFTVIGGKYNKRKVWSMIGLHSDKGPKWGQMGRAFVRAALESARGIAPDDMTERGLKARQIKGLSDLTGLEFVAKIDVQEGEGDYGDKNVIQNVIPTTHKDYRALMDGSAPSAPMTQSAPQTTSGNTPAWMNG